MRFVSNWKSFRLQGAHTLPHEGDYVVITKSMKDVMVFHEFGIPAIAPISENCYLTDAQHNKLVKKFKHVVLVYDNDRPGKVATVKIYRQHPELYACWLPSGTAKDISDYYAKYGREKTQKLIDYAKEKIAEEKSRRKSKETKKSETKSC